MVSSEITSDEVDFVRIDKGLIHKAIEVLDTLKKRGLKAEEPLLFTRLIRSILPSRCRLR